MELTDKQITVGAHVLSEWLDDEAPLNEKRYRVPAASCFKAMLNAATPSEDVVPLLQFRAVFARAAQSLRVHQGEASPDAKVLQALADSILPANDERGPDR